MHSRPIGQRDHGGGLYAAMQEFGGDRADWLDLSTGINPVPYPIADVSSRSWQSLPDHDAITGLEAAARRFWDVPSGLEIVSAGGASALIAALPRLLEGRRVNIPEPTYNEHAAAFNASGWIRSEQADWNVVVNPNNPDGRVWTASQIGPKTIIDESFCDVCPDASLINMAAEGAIILKSFGKFWGLAGLRLGFAICLPDFANVLREALGPWQVSGPACEIGTTALNDLDWKNETRRRLDRDAARLDGIIARAGNKLIGGTSLFRLLETTNAEAVYRHLAERKILIRIFPYSKTWVRFGLPAPDQFERVANAVERYA